MGSPISSVVAEAVLQWLEHVAMAQYQPKFWARYVDDTFVVIKRSQKAGFVDVLNSVCVDLQFTEEGEHQGELAFLDVLVRRHPNGSLTTRVYRKSTHTDRILHFNSNHPISHKVSCVRTLFKRVDSHCSTAEARTEERKHLLRLCRHNGYPIKFIKRYSGIPQLPQNPSGGATSVQMTRITLPYVSNVSEATSRLLAPHGIQVAHRPDRTLRSCIMKPKDLLPVVEKSGVVYRINCSDCPSNYVGETSKKVGTRMQEHKLAIRRGEQYSQILTHIMEHDHKFDFENVSVVASDSSKSGRLLKEAWFSDNMSINRHVDLRPAYQTMRAWETRTHSRRKHPCIRSLEHRTERTRSQEGQGSPPEPLPTGKLHPHLRQTKELFDTSAPFISTSNNNPPHDTWHLGKSLEATPIEINRLHRPEDYSSFTPPSPPSLPVTVEVMRTPSGAPADNSPRVGRHPERRLGASFIRTNQVCHPEGRSSTTSVLPLNIGIIITPTDIPDDSSPRGARHLGMSAENTLTDAGQACCAEDHANGNASNLVCSIVDSGVGGAGLVGVTPVPGGDGAAPPRHHRTAENRALAEPACEFEARRGCFGGVAAAPCQATVQRAGEFLGPNTGLDHTLNEDGGYRAEIRIGMTSTPWGASPGPGQSPGISGLGRTTVGGGGENRMSEDPGGYHTRMESVLTPQEVSPMVGQGPLVSESGDTGGNGGEDGMNEGCKEYRTRTITSAPQGVCTTSGQSPSGERLGRTVGVNGGESVMNGDCGGCRRTIESKLSGNRSRHKVPGRQHTNIQTTEDETRRGLRERYPRECKRRNQPVGTECTLNNKITHLPPGLKAEGKWELGKRYDAIGDDGRELGTASEAGTTRVGPITRSMRRNLMKRL